MADFAVGQSRMLYGTTMHSERAQHRMSEQWHPLGPVGVITGPSIFPSRSGPERVSGCDCRRYGCVEAFAESAALRDRGATPLQPRDGATGLSRDLSLIVTAEKTIAETVGPGSPITVDLVHRVRTGRSSCGHDRRATAGRRCWN